MFVSVLDAKRCQAELEDRGRRLVVVPTRGPARPRRRQEELGRAEGGRCPVAHALVRRLCRLVVVSPLRGGRHQEDDHREGRRQGDARR